jgi:hypothetical protein
MEAVCLFFPLRSAWREASRAPARLAAAERELHRGGRVSSWVSRVTVVVFVVTGASMASAQPNPPIRLKARTFAPPAMAAAARPAPRPGAPRPLLTGRRPHLIVQFHSAIQPSDLADLRRAGAQPLRYVPDHALAIAADPAFDPAALPRIRWAGTLQPTDKVSDGTQAELARDFPRFPITVVEFHPDVTAEEVADHLAGVGVPAVAGPPLPAYMSLVSTDAVALRRLAELDAVAWMYPASAAILTAGVRLCEGVTAGATAVAEYATVGDGWDGPGTGGADLGVYLLRSTADTDRTTASREIDRALAEWARHIDIRWRMAADPYEARSLTVSWEPVDHGDGFPFAPEVLAHAFYHAPVVPEPLAGDVHFNDAFQWAAGDPGRYDIFSVMLHEVGHSLGLAHSSDPDGVMYAMYRGIVSGLSPSDVAAARSLYGAPGAAPPGWSTTAIGGAPGSTTWSGDRVTIESAGRDVWDTADQFRFVSRSVTGDVDIVTRVDSLAAVHRWTKAGVMIRADAAAGSPHAFMLVSGEKGLAFQRRPERDGLSVSTEGGAGTAPRWLWLSRRGDRFEAYAAVDGGAWTRVGTDTIPMPASVLAGLALTSHHDGAIATAVFSNTVVTTPPAWSHADVGAVAVKGSFSHGALQLRVAGSGADIWGTADAFHFAWLPLDGDGDIVARVASVQHTDRWAKAGVMLRASLEPGAAHAFMLVSAAKGYAFQRRPQDGGISYHTAGGEGAAPQWVKLQRRGATVTAFRSADGVTWAVVGSETIALGQRVLAGLAVTSHDPTVTSVAVFDNVSVR